MVLTMEVSETTNSRVSWYPIIDHQGVFGMEWGFRELGGPQNLVAPVKRDFGTKKLDAVVVAMWEFLSKPEENTSVGQWLYF